MTRLDVHDKLKSATGLKHIYFQPPESLKITYPCIIYKLESLPIVHADNSHYKLTASYQITLIDKDPDSLIFRDLLDLPFCKFDRFYTSDNINHWVFTLKTNYN